MLERRYDIFAREKRGLRSMRIWLFILTALATIGASFTSTAQDTQLLQCLEVNPDGSIQITWDQFDNADSNFDFYQLSRRSSSQGVYTLVTTIFDITQTSFTDTDVTLDTSNDYYCYQLLIAFNDGSPAENTNDLCTMLMDATPSAPPGYVDLTWNNPVPNDSSVPDGTIYKVYYEYPAGTWLLAGFFNYDPGITSFNYEVTVCDAFVNFRIELEMPGASCSSTSNIVGLPVVDNTSPDTPVISSISVDSVSGNAIIDWFPSSAPDCGGYIIYQCLNGSVTEIDMIFDPLASDYIYANSNANLTTESYLIAAFDTCAMNLSPPVGNTSPTESNCPSIHTTMLLANNWATCQDFVDLAWTPYTGWGEDGVAYYEVYRRTNNGADEFLAVVESTENTYRDHTIDINTDYCYYIKAYSTTIINATSITNLSCLTISTPPEPANFSLFSASVTDEKEITISVSTSPTTTFFDYVLLRKKGDDPFFRQVDNVIENNSGFIFFTDNNVEPSVFSYTYQVALVNQCIDTVMYSNIGKTILLDGLANSESLINTISWTGYEEWGTGVDRYEIYRSIDDGPVELIGTNGSNILYYEDDVSPYLSTKGEFCYYVVAQESGNPLGVDANSVSNIHCITQPPLIWIPNAFAVNGINSEFKPVISFADRDTYRMIVYNRWGQEIFQTQDLDEGWDGRKNGNLIQEGNYMYYMEIRDGAGKLYEFRGPLTMLIYDAN